MRTQSPSGLSPIQNPGAKKTDSRQSPQKAVALTDIDCGDRVQFSGARPIELDARTMELKNKLVANRAKRQADEFLGALGEEIQAKRQKQAEVEELEEGEIKEDSDLEEGEIREDSSLAAKDNKGSQPRLKVDKDAVKRFLQHDLGIKNSKNSS